jgi:hypothetical protein
VGSFDAFLPPGVPPERKTPPEVAQRWAAMHAWGDRNLSGDRLALYRGFCERERQARMKGLTLRRMKGTPNPWSMDTPDDVAEGVVYYEVPVQSEDDYLWECLCEAMLRDSRITYDIGSDIGRKAETLPSATPERMRRLRGAFRHRFAAQESPHAERSRVWSQATPDDFADMFEEPGRSR